MTDSPPPSGNPPRPTGPQVLLGAFIIWQLFFLLSINLLDLTRDLRDELSDDQKKAVNHAAPDWARKEGHANDLADVLYGVDKRWAQMTGQIQGWSLFAPGVRRHCIFPAVVLRWDEEPLSAPAIARPLTALASSGPLECAALSAAAWQSPPPLPPRDAAATALAPLAASGPLDGATLAAAASLRQPSRPPYPAETLLSDNEPRDMASYVRVGLYRLRRYEGNLVIVLRPVAGETPAETAERWRERLRDHVREYGDYIKTYLEWRLKRFRDAHPEHPAPRQVVFVLRRWSIADAERAPPLWSGPHEVPAARWLPGVAWEGGREELEVYNPVRQRFEPRR